MKVKPWGTKYGKTYAYSITIMPTIAPSAMECQNTKRKIMPSLPSWFVAAVATQMDCASTILPITPPALVAAVKKIGTQGRCSAGVGFKPPNKPVDGGALAGGPAPKHPQKVPKNGENHPGRRNSRP